MNAHRLSQDMTINISVHISSHNRLMARFTQAFWPNGYAHNYAEEEHDLKWFIYDLDDFYCVCIASKEITLMTICLCMISKMKISPKCSMSRTAHQKQTLQVFCSRGLPGWVCEPGLVWSCCKNKNKTHIYGSIVTQSYGSV